MSRQATRDTGPELALRRRVHARGLRYTLDAALPLPGVRRRADLLFSRARVAVFMDSCFWHACPIHATWPKANAAWWERKLRDNRRRDLDTDSLLSIAGWMSIRVWEHDDLDEAASGIAAEVRARLGASLLCPPRARSKSTHQSERRSTRPDRDAPGLGERA